MPLRCSVLDARSIATLGIGLGGAHVARIGLLARTAPLADYIPGGRWQPGKKSRLRHPAHADVLLRLGCAVSASAGLRLGAEAAVDTPVRLDSTAGLRLGAGVSGGAETTVAAAAAVVDVVLEMLLLSD